MNEYNSSIPAALVESLRGARYIAVLTGAGVSAESGIPTFRQAQTGLWAQYDPEQLATAAAFRRNRQLVWSWYQWRRELVTRAAPNPAHEALASIEDHVERLTLITQNVDGLHQQAGSSEVIELHGNIRRNKCFQHGHVVAPADELAAEHSEDPPCCPLCQSYLRPDVVWFGESLPVGALDAAFAAAQECDFFMAVGTSAVVHPAASLPLLAIQGGAVALEINPQQTPLSSRVDFVLRGPAGELLPRLLEECWPDANRPGA